MTRLHLTPDDVAELLDHPDVVVVDTRSAPEGRAAYASGHVPGAVHLDWLDDWSDPDDSVEGQLAGPERFASALGRVGIGPDSTVVAYDDGTLFLASRLAWALEHYGHPGQVHVLAGGWPAWLRAGWGVSNIPPSPIPVDYPAPHPGQLRVGLEEVRAAVADGSATLVDCRMDSTWDASGAHIPTARRLPSPSVFGPSGAPRNDRELRRLASNAGITPERSTILYCGGGVSAAAVREVLKDLGLGQLLVYDGSWSEWSAVDGTPREAHTA